jgi:hypothetical protein
MLTFAFNCPQTNKNLQSTVLVTIVRTSPIHTARSSTVLWTIIRDRFALVGVNRSSWCEYGNLFAIRQCNEGVGVVNIA